MIGNLPKIGRRLPRGMFSSLRTDWATPRKIFRCLDAEFHFTLDACATPETAVCARYFDPLQTDALQEPWEGVVWLNPPYKHMGLWLAKAAQEARRGAVVVALVAARTDTSWWHKYAMNATEIRFLRGRLHFDDTGTTAPFSSAIIVFGKEPL